MNSTAQIGFTEEKALHSSRPNHWIIEHYDRDCIIVRSEHAHSIEPSDWRERLCNMLKSIHGAAVVGAKRLTNSGAIYSMGEFVIHPKGFHSVGRNLPGHAYRFPEDVDAITGGAIAIDRELFNDIGGTDILKGELGALDLSLAFRNAGKRCITVPDVIALDDHSPTPDEGEQYRFEKKWGFNWRSVDMKAVQNQYKGTGLLWNVRFHGENMPFCKYKERPAFHWKSYSEVEIFRERANQIMQNVMKYTQTGSRLLDVGCGDGLYSHIAALCGANATGIDMENEAIEQAKTMTGNVDYPITPPSFLTGNGGDLPFNDCSFNTVIMLDVIEHLQNPAHMLRDIERIVKNGGHFILTTPLWNYQGWSDPVYHITEYSLQELTSQIEAATSLNVIEQGLLSKSCRDLIVVCQKQV